MNQVTIRCTIAARLCGWIGNFECNHLPSRTLGLCPWCGQDSLEMRITNYKQKLGL